MTATRLILNCPGSNLTLIVAVAMPPLAGRCLSFECPCGNVHELILRHSDHAGSGGKARPTSFRRLGRGPDALRVGDRRSTFAGVVATMRARTARQERIAQRIGDRPRPSSTATAGPSAISVFVERFCLSCGFFICGRLGRLLLCFQ